MTVILIAFIMPYPAVYGFMLNNIFVEFLIFAYSFLFDNVDLRKRKMKMKKEKIVFVNAILFTLTLIRH